MNPMTMTKIMVCLVKMDLFLCFGSYLSRMIKSYSFSSKTTLGLTMDKSQEPTDKLLSEVYQQFENNENGQELEFLNAGIVDDI